MIKLFRFLTRSPETTQSEATTYWTEKHAPLVVDALGDVLLRYVTNVGLPTNWGSDGPAEAPPWDGIDEMWLDISAGDVKKVFGGKAEVLIPSEQQFLGNSQWMVVEEVVQREGANSSYQFKLLEPLVRRRDKTWDEFRDFWLNQHAPLVRKTWDASIARYMTNLGLANPFNWRLPEEGPPYDGVAEFYFNWTLDEYRASLIETAHILIPDEEGLVSSWRAVLVDEIVQKDDA